MKINPILLQVFRNRFVAIAEEMGVTLGRTAFSPNIKERCDYSCALFDSNGDMIAQAAHIPVHLGSMPLSVKAAIKAIPMAEGDMVMLNDPFAGGTHLPDITLVAPVYVSSCSDPAFYVANRAHHSDVGGMSPGSMPVASSIFQEGIIIPPTKIVSGGAIDRNLFNLLLRNVRTPQEREGDFSAQLMANLTGVSRCQQLVEKYSLQMTRDYAGHLNDYAEKMLRLSIAAIPDGQYSFSDNLDSDGFSDQPVPLKLTLKIAGDSAELDFRDCAPQVQGSVNAVYAITLSAVLYVFRCLIKEDVPTNAGIARPLTILTKAGTVVDAQFPAAVAGGNVETSQRIVDLLLGALAQAIPEQIPAASQGTMNNTTIGGIDPRSGQPFSYYETLAGGCGASSQCDGASAVHSHMTNTLNTPIEALEYAFPFRVTQYSIRPDSGGAGQRHGGEGLIREIEMLEETEVTVLTERRSFSPYGLAGGQAGQTGRNLRITTGKPEKLAGKTSRHFDAGERLRIETPGGGGWGWGTPR